MTTAETEIERLENLAELGDREARRELTRLKRRIGGRTPKEITQFQRELRNLEFGLGRLGKDDPMRPAAEKRAAYLHIVLDEAGGDRLTDEEVEVKAEATVKKKASKKKESK